MMDGRYIELINKEVDGLNSPSDHEELMKFLSTDSEALKLYEDLLITSDALRSVKDVPPPPYLKHHIMNAIRSTPARHRDRSDWLAAFAGVLRRRASLRYGLVFASGLCIGILFFVLAYPWQHQGSSDTSRLTGSMIGPAELARLPLIDAAHIERNGIEGTFRTYRSEGNVFVEISVESPEGVSIEINCDPIELAFAGVRSLDGVVRGVNVTQGKVVLTDVQRDKTLLTFTENSQVQRTLEVRIYRGNSEVEHVTLRAH